LSAKDELLRTGAAAKQAGISSQSLQYYLMLGLVKATEVTPTGRRLFNKRAVEQIRLVKKLNESGYTLRAIRELFLEGQGRLKGGVR
jgi:MerR family copper efflux transcriptional regulator